VYQSRFETGVEVGFLDFLLVVGTTEVVLSHNQCVEVPVRVVRIARVELIHEDVTRSLEAQTELVGDAEVDEESCTSQRAGFHAVPVVLENLVTELYATEVVGVEVVLGSECLVVLEEDVGTCTEDKAYIDAAVMFLATNEVGEVHGHIE